MCWDLTIIFTIGIFITTIYTVDSFLETRRKAYLEKLKVKYVKLVKEKFVGINKFSTEENKIKSCTIAFPDGDEIKVEFDDANN